MEKALEREIVRHAKSVIKRYELKRWIARKHARNFRKRTGKPPTIKPVPIPDTWNLHPHFNPKYCIAHSKYLARTIWRKICADRYQPTPAVAVSIPKPGGDFRQIMIFTVPDAAVAQLFRTRLTIRNAKLLSANTYAYRFDKNLFDALLFMRAAVAAEKVFVVQYDFRKYFDTISHSYLSQLIHSERIFLTSKIEQHVVASFLTHRFAEKKAYKAKQFLRKDLGIPQGSSISLWLANVAGHELDRDLEKRNGQFVRYADDVVCVAHSYEDALGIARVFVDHCRRAGLTINEKKSPGINLLSENVQELRTVAYFDFLGHKFTKEGIYLTDKAIQRIKQRITKTLQVHLLFYPKTKNLFNRNRIGPQYFDWDLVTCLNEIRRYIYGGLKESQLQELIFKNVRPPRVKGLMSFYLLISDPEQLRQLDGWLLTTLRRTLVERYRILAAAFGVHQNVPSSATLKTGKWYSYATIKSETRCPSFLRAWRGARKYYFRFGLGDVVPPGYYGYKSRGRSVLSK